MKLTVLALLIPFIGLSQNKINLNIGGTFAGNCHNGGYVGATAAAGYWLNNNFTLGLSGDYYPSTDAKFGAVKADFIIYPQHKEKGGSLFIAASPGYTLASSERKGNFAFDGMIGGKAIFGGFAVYASCGYGLTTFGTGKNISKNEGFKMRLAFGI